VWIDDKTFYKKAEDQKEFASFISGETTCLCQ